MKKATAGLCQAVKAGEQSALETLVDLFDWLDGLDSQPTAEIVPLYKERQPFKTMITNTPRPVGPPVGLPVAKIAEKPVVSFHFACTYCSNPMLTERCERFF